MTQEAKDLPEEWTNGMFKTLYVVRDLGLKKSGVPADLRVKYKRGEDHFGPLRRIPPFRSRRPQTKRRTHQRRQREANNP